MKVEHPKVTVMMTVYNGERYIATTIESILNQTYSDFEYLIVNNGSTDKTVDIIGSYNDSRIKLLHNETMLNLAESRNICFQEARGEYLAWIDADDISLPERLEKQVEVMEKYPEVGLCSTDLKCIDEEGAVLGDKGWYQKSPIPLEWKLIWENQIAQPTVMLRKSVVEKHNFRYRQDFPPSEDYDLWCRMALVTHIYRIYDVLLLYRIHSNSTGAKNLSKSYKMALQASSEYASQVLGNEPPEYYKYLTVFTYRANIPSRYFSPGKMYTFINSLLVKSAAHWRWDKKQIQAAKKFGLKLLYDYFFRLSSSSRFKGFCSLLIYLKLELAGKILFKYFLTIKSKFRQVLNGK